MATAQEPTSTAPSPEEGGDPRPVLEHALEFDKAGYKTGDRVAVTVTITNTGDADTVVHAREPHGPDREPGYVHLDLDTWGDLYYYDGVGVRLAAGASFTHVFRGIVVDLDAAETVFTVDFLTDKFDIWDVRATAPLERAEGAFAGTTYLDRNGNRTVDAGEPVAGATVTLRHRYDDAFSATAVSDADGRFLFAGLAPVSHRATVDDLDGWQFAGVGVDIVADETAELDLAGVRAFREGLTAQIAFTEDEYQPGDVAEIDVTLTNTGTVRLAGITAQCNRIGDTHHLEDVGWGELSYTGGGMALDAGKTFRTRVRGTVPEAARRYGVVEIACDFGFDGSTNPRASDLARVPGGTGSVIVTTFEDRDGDDAVDRGEHGGGLAVTLTDRATGRVSVTRRANADGVVAFTSIPAGRYGVAVSGPWDVEPGQSDVLVASGGCWYTCEFDIRLVPGEPDPTTTPSPTPEPTTTTTPAPQASPPPGNLPDTGADVRWLFALGVLTVLAGAGLLLIRRKRA